MGKSSGEIVLGILAIANTAAIAYFGYSIQKTQTQIQDGQLLNATTVANAQERAAQIKFATDLFPYLLSKERRQREMGLVILRRAVPEEFYFGLLASMALKDPDPSIRSQAIKDLGASKNKTTLETLNAITEDPSRPQAERDVARQAEATVTANYEAVKACDLNHDGRVDGVDVQMAINQANGIAPCTADLTIKGKCSVTDVQRVISASMGMPCVVTR